MDKMKDIKNFFKDIERYEDRYYQNLMQTRVSNILLISTYYDAFIFEEDGKLSEQISGEYNELNLSAAPNITNVYTGEEALEELAENHYDLVITSFRIGNMKPAKLAAHVKAINEEIPVVLLLNSLSDISVVRHRQKLLDNIDEVFLWNGESKIFLAIVKQMEDRLNLDTDTKEGLVRIILLIEDSIHYYSMFLPVLYTQIMKHIQKLISSELNDKQKLLRMRARPKVMLVHNRDEAEKIVKNYQRYLWCIISDVKYNYQGELDENAGINFLQEVKKHIPYIPMVLQSSDKENKAKADAIGVPFIHKNSQNLLKELISFINYSLGFGDFYFRTKEGEITATNWTELEKALKKVSTKVLKYHAKRNHFSIWFSARGEIQIAMKLRSWNIDKFENLEEMRKFLIEVVRFIRKKSNRGRIIDFNKFNLDMEDEIVRLAAGSFGGKGRGLAFLNHFLIWHKLDQIEGVRIKIPKTSIIGTEEYDYFIESNEIIRKLNHLENGEIKKIFLKGKLSAKLEKKLKAYLKVITKPLAVRSSSLLEDSQFQPFAGVYETYMIPNNHEDMDIRYSHLAKAIKLVYASTFLKNAKQYMEGLQYKFEEEKMAVVIQVIVGNQYEKYFYPHFSGVAQSHNFYSMKKLPAESGICSLALGLGMTIVEGEKVFLFSPASPKRDMIDSENMLKNSQTEFYTIDLHKTDFDLAKGESCTLKKLGLRKAEEHGTLEQAASTIDRYSGMMYAGTQMKGVRVLNFANIVKYNAFPLANILKKILKHGEKAMGVPIEIEFAVNLSKNNEEQSPTFYLLQIRPLTLNEEDNSIDIEEQNKDDLILYSGQSMGNGTFETYDIVYIPQSRYDNTLTEEMAAEIENINEEMKMAKRRYILMGPGRWGSRDRFLGIPVRWNQISFAQLIIETDTREHHVEASYGSHFFHNILSMNVGYLSVMQDDAPYFIDWEWLDNQTLYKDNKYFKQIRTNNPITIKIDGRQNEAIIKKPD